MKFVINNPKRENIYNLLRGIGYHFLDKDEKTGELNFTRPMRGFPRFHIYLKIDGSTGSPRGDEDLIFNLHLDQKKPSYKGATAHSGEYDGATIEQEAERIKKELK